MKLEKKIVVCGLNRATKEDKESKCSECGREIFITDDWNKGDYKLICRKCFIEKYLDDIFEGKGEMDIRPETVKKVAEHFGVTEREVLDKLFSLIIHEKFGEEKEIVAG